MIRRLILALFIVALVFGGLSCDKASQANKIEEKKSPSTYKVVCSEVRTYIEATGSVQADLEGTSKVLSPLAGIVSRIDFRVGDRVHKGDVLMAVTTPDITDAYSTYLSTLTQLRQAERVYNLNKQLFEIGAVTKNDLLNSEAAHRQLVAVAGGLKSKLEIYGFKTDDEAIAKQQNRIDTILIKAPMTGYIGDIQAHLGDKVDASTPLMTLADPNNIVVVANIYDTDVQKVKREDKVIFYADIFPGTAFNGVITYVSDLSDVDLKTVKTFIKVLDKKTLFKQNMFLQLKIEGEKKILPLVPQSAMVYKDGKFYVYYSSKDGKQSLREIKPVKEVPGKLVAVEGVSEGDELIVTAIDLEKP